MTDQPLSQNLREATAKPHEELESHPFSAQLQDASIPEEVYRHYLHGLSLIYERLESALAHHRKHPVLQAFYDEDLLRHGTLLADLHHHGTPDPPPAEPPVAARIAQWEQSRPLALIAAAYVRYLGDLGGGQMFLRRFQQKWRLAADDHTGLRFYVFPVPVHLLRTRLRTALDSAVLTSAEQSLVVDAAVEAFEDHGAWFDQLMNAASPEWR